MTITLTANYKEVLKLETVEFIEENCVEGEYDLDDALKFIDEHNEDAFVAYYDEYIRVGEILGYDVVDAFIEHQGDVSYVENVEDAYRGVYSSEAEFAEEFYSDLGDVPVGLVIDWEATWKQSLSYDFDFVNGYVFSSSF
jgi:hypothetical protein